ncbi:MAG TPA: LLM class flavin-dependent oxidoreductase, partial [Acidimicrobiia bacterium]|nr:LLM class flavin-dependent oxidoreductase [Acidimicrobiia bacterium]
MRVGVGLLTFEAGMRGGLATWSEAYRAGTEFALTAEALGFDHVWVSEHHAWYTGYCPAGLVASAALLARTSTIGVATGIVSASVRPPAELAAVAHRLSVESAGRFELGIGRGYRVLETTTVGGLSRSALGRAVPDFLEEWGRLRPRTPLWVAATARKAVRRAAA